MLNPKKSFSCRYEILNSDREVVESREYANTNPVQS